MKTKYILTMFIIFVLALVTSVVLTHEPVNNMCYEGCKKVHSDICYEGEFYGCNMKEMICSEYYGTYANIYSNSCLLE